MNGALRGLLTLAFVALAVAAAPAGALACGGGGTSAQQVYVECVPNGGGGHSGGGGGGGGAGTSGTHGGSTSHHQAPIPKGAARVMARADKKDKAVLSELLKNPNLGASRSLSPATGSATSPSALGAAFDLGSGPTALIAVLAATAMILLGVSGVRSWRRWHES